jgi:hypothetical protein
VGVDESGVDVEAGRVHDRRVRGDGAIRSDGFDEASADDDDAVGDGRAGNGVDGRAGDGVNGRSVGADERGNQEHRDGDESPECHAHLRKSAHDRTDRIACPC